MTAELKSSMVSDKHILVTGGTGYIGTHASIVLMQAGYEVIIIDNLSNSHIEVLDKIEQIVGKRPLFVQGDIRDAKALDAIFRHHPINAVVHFAGLKAVGESVEKPLDYYHANISGTIELLRTMRGHKVFSLVFSSSATVYGLASSEALTEDAPRSAQNPYGRTKLMIEEILIDLAASDPAWHIACLRYFNPVGAHASGLIGENPKGIPNNLVPYMTQVATGKQPELAVFGNDYPTKDGTGMRDYIHVVDLAEGHVAALNYIASHSGLMAFNLGTGQGYSVLDMVHAFEKASGKKIPLRMAPRRPGDVPVSLSNPTRAETLLGWKATRDLDAMCADTWKWINSQQ